MVSFYLALFCLSENLEVEQLKFRNCLGFIFVNCIAEKNLLFLLLIGYYFSVVLYSFFLRKDKNKSSKVCNCCE